ncbi:uncharacterized protein J4E88_001592 [Alternaria novae-zelandiae]|uniref:uncharacterized protein n=1 Tax=Alternaria novae-zelandiae TaxID=430562 RepID=UPI0020C59F15|nr:uncharacterized protein J4E88_001592 [Alternaria novae-zelandiae]KAI4693221.1 hypothetical protein J4E88_001592 [Alternaria novae-zelandiae]
MAPNGHAASGRKSTHKSSDSSPVFWEDKHGHREFMDWKEANQNGPSPSYEEWVESQKMTGGLSLYYTALSMFEESDSTDEEAPPVKAKPQATKARGQVGRPKKTAAANGNGASRAAESATPSAVANSEDQSPSGKKKRKARKKPLSDEVIASASDEGETSKDLGASVPGAETATPTVPAIAVNGQRKSSTRKARKKPISEETISPEDELEDPMETTIDEVAASAIVSPLPVRSAPKSSTAATASETPKKSHILKLSTRKTPKTKTASEDSAIEGGAAEAGAHTEVTPTNVAEAIELNATFNRTVTPSASSKMAQDVDSAAASPDPTTASAGSTRRGLRTRKPAQQRPYYHDSQLFEDVEPTNGDAQESNNTSPTAEGRRASVASISRNIDDALLASLDEEAMALLQEETEPEPAKPKHFKGKGRAWKKEGSDEDEEFSLAAKKKAAKAAKLKAKGQIPKKRGRPRKSGRSEELIDEEDEDKEAVKRKRPPPRKSALSEEVIIESSEDEEVKEMEVEESTTPKYTPNKSYTPQGLPNSMSKDDIGTNGDAELGADDEPEPVSPSKKTA